MSRKQYILRECTSLARDPPTRHEIHAWKRANQNLIQSFQDVIFQFSHVFRKMLAVKIQ
jgi:hypothetical protein